MELPAQTLHDFVLNLLQDPQALSAFDLDPEGVLGKAGLGDINAADVHEIIPLVMDYTPMQLPAGLDALPAAGLAEGRQAAIAHLHQVTQALGSQLSAQHEFQNATLGLAGADDMHSAAGGFASTGSISSPLGESLFSSAGSPDGQFSMTSEFTSQDGSVTTTGGVTGAVASGVTAGNDVSSPLADSSFTAAGGMNGHFAGNGEFASDTLGTTGTLAVDGSPNTGLDVAGAIDSPLGSGSFQLQLPGADQFTSQHPQLGTQAMATGADTVASALANPAAVASGAVADPSAAVRALAGNLPLNAAGPHPLALAGDSSQVDAVRQTVDGAVHGVTGHVGNAVMPNVAPHLTSLAGADQVSHTLGQVSDQLHGLGGALPNVPAVDPMHAVSSATDGLPDTVGHVASDSPLSQLSGVSGVDSVTHAVEHNAVTDDAHHLLGGIADLGPHF